MAKTVYCWRCAIDVPMLEDHEWKLVHRLFANPIEQIKRYRQTHEVSLAEAHNRFGQKALKIYHSMTGFEETNAAALWHHRVSLYGPPCRACGKPLRTPHAKMCAACGADR